MCHSKTCHFGIGLIYDYFLFIFQIGITLLYNAVLVSAIQQHESALCVYIYIYIYTPICVYMYTPHDATPLGYHKAPN